MLKKLPGSTPPPLASAARTMTLAPSSAVPFP